MHRVTTGLLAFGFGVLSPHITAAADLKMAPVYKAATVSGATAIRLPAGRSGTRSCGRA
jgi:hypothetical protein